MSQFYTNLQSIFSNSIKNRVLLRKVFAFYNVLLITALSIPGRQVSNVELVGVDKVVHFIMFSVWAYIFIKLIGISKKDIVIVLVIGSVFSALTEVYQHVLIPNRIGDGYDALADVIGIIFALAISSFLAKS